MYYSRHDDRRAATWTLSAGNARAGYPVSALGSSDPSEPCWIEENEIAVVGDLGAALEVQAVFLFGHTFAEGTNVRLQATGIDVPIPIEAPYLSGDTCHAWVNLEAEIPSAGTRTRQNWTITNVGDPNDRSVAIGEIWIAGRLRILEPYSLGHDYQRATEYLIAASSSKRGVQTIYDTGSRSRMLAGGVRTTAPDVLLDWHDVQRGRVRPTVIILDPDGDTQRDREPHLCRFATSRRVLASIKHDTAADVALEFEELGSGELIEDSGEPGV